MKLLLAILLLTTTALAEVPDNAALLYWQAFATLPPIDDEFDERLRQWRSMEVDEPMGALETVATPMEFVHRAAKTPACDWGIDWSDGYATVLPHLGKSRTLARIACLRGRIYMLTGRHRQAIDDFCAAIAIARHLSNSALIGKLVHISVESDAIQGLGDHLAAFNSDELSYLETRLEALPPAPSLADALRLEMRFAVQELEETQVTDMAEACRLAANFNGVLNDLDEPTLSRVLEIFGRISEVDYALARQFVPLPESRADAEDLMRQLLALEAVRSGDTVIHLDGTIGLDPDAPPADNGIDDSIAACQDLLQRAVDLAELPLSQMTEQVEALDEDFASAPTIARNLLPNLTPAIRRHAGCELRNSMLRAAIAVLRNDESALGRIPDPVTGEPFSLSREGMKITLASSFNDSRGPVSFTADRSSEVAPPPEIPKYMTDALRDLSKLREGQHGDNPAARAAYDKFYQDMEKRVDTVLEHLDQREDDTRDAMVRLLVSGALDFVDTWVDKIDDAIAGNHSAFIAASIVLRTPAPVMEASIIHYSLIQGREELEDIIGKSAAEELIFLVDERRRQLSK